MTRSAKVNLCSCITLQRLRPNRDKEGRAEFLTALSSGCALRTSLEMVYRSIQSQRCKDALLRNSFYKSSFGALMNLNKFLEGLFNRQNIEIFVTPSKIYKQQER